MRPTTITSIGVRSAWTIITLAATVAVGSGCASHHRLPARRASQPNATPATKHGVQRLSFDGQGRRLTVEVLADDLVRFVLQATEAPAGQRAIQPVAPSPMVVKTRYPGPTKLRVSGHSIQTAQVRLDVEPGSLRVRVRDLVSGAERELTTFGPTLTASGERRLSIRQAGATHVYGLGQFFGPPGEADGDWLGRVRAPGNSYGNRMVLFNGGAVGNTQFPIMYALGKGRQAYGIFVDQPEAQNWDFRSDPWRMSCKADVLRWYVLIGPDLADVRRDYVQLVGRPLVPPKKAFGLWISEYGYRDWADVTNKLTSLRQKNFPVDGFVLDLFWFGGVVRDSGHSPMGTLRWNPKGFADARQRIAAFGKQGVGVMVIEEPYVSQQLQEFRVLEDAGYLVRRCEHCEPAHLSDWWGKGGMVDFTCQAAADFWHDYRRAALVRDGVLGHWTDLGEPHHFDPTAWYNGTGLGGHSHAAVANMYNFRWLESIHRGYRRQGVSRRPMMISRSGAPGMQRFGAVMWSGDIASNLSSLRSHFNAQMHMSLSGVDYFGSDIGGFTETKAEGDVGEMYTQWLASGMAVDVPGRPHTNNLSRKRETAPDRIGDWRSNLHSVRLRYRLSPYVYSLAHNAYRTGNPVFPPPVLHFPEDTRVRRLGAQKMIGPHLMVRLVARHEAKDASVYLPAGTWVDYHANTTIHSRGQWIQRVPLYRSGRLVLPLFARAGAVLPEMRVDDQTLNILGDRRGADRCHDLIVRVFPSPKPSSFVLLEDDGQTTAYLEGAVRSTPIKQQLRSHSATVVIDPARGTFDGAPQTRRSQVILVDPWAATSEHQGGQTERRVHAVWLNGESLSRHASLDALDRAPSGWCLTGRVVHAKSTSMSVSASKTFVFHLGDSDRAP